MKVTKIQDDGNKFILHGESGLYDRVREVFENIAPGVNVTPSEEAEAHILYNENNRDIVLGVLDDHTRG
ncbi:MAG: hypothetical protein ABEJ75_01365 [Candidatus Nanohaloarchaea archaeon]